MQEFITSDYLMHDQYQNDSHIYIKRPDKMEAVHYYLKAANYGKDVEALNCLGLIYEQGLGLDIAFEGKQHGPHLWHRHVFFEEGLDRCSGSFHRVRGSTSSAAAQRGVWESLWVPTEEICGVFGGEGLLQDCGLEF